MDRKRKKKRRDCDGERENGRKVVRETVGGGNENRLEGENESRADLGPRLGPKRSLEVIISQQKREQAGPSAAKCVGITSLKNVGHVDIRAKSTWDGLIGGRID